MHKLPSYSTGVTNLHAGKKFHFPFPHSQFLTESNLETPESSNFVHVDIVKIPRDGGSYADAYPL